MKKVFTIGLVFLYLFSTAGVILNHHYCGETLKGITFFTKPEHCCPTASCCDNAVSILKIDTDQNISFFTQGFLKVFYSIIPFFDKSDFTFYPVAVDSIVKPPPDDNDIAGILYLKNRVLRI